jgi:ATP-dependent helicase/nuclease subunit A
MAKRKNNPAPRAGAKPARPSTNKDDEQSDTPNLFPQGGEGDRTLPLLPQGKVAEGQEPPDQDQRNLIIHELDKNVLVEAAAGTGKTTSLVARMVCLLKEGKCSIDTLAAVTFTRKAAAELRARFQVELEKAAREADGVALDRLIAAVAHVERCYLGTIHSFCARLLRERPVEAGVDAAFRELDDPDDRLLRRRAWDEHVARLIAGNDPLLAELDDFGLEIGQLAPTFFQFADYPDVEDWPIPTTALPNSLPVLTALQTYTNHMQDVAETFPDDVGNDRLMPKYRLLPRMVRQANLDRPAELLEILEQFTELGPKTVVQRNWPEGRDQALAELEAWNEFARTHAVEHVANWHRARYGPVLRAIRPALTAYDRLRREASGLNFQDLLVTAARLLRDKRQIREYFRGRFTHLLVDEFQDTDPLQAEVMLFLTADDPAETDWRRCRPVKGSLFVVGDPKQSIYRFRRADIVTYNEVKRLIQASGGLVVSLTANFRTTAPLVEWINQTFADRFPETASEVAPARCPLQVGRVGDHCGDLAGLYQLTVPGKTKGEALEYEAAFVARTIRHALDAPLTVPRSRKELERKVSTASRPGDFLIVTRNTSNLSLYARKLQELGVPHQVTGGTALNELEELYLLHTCLRAVVRPDDPVALVGALRCELFGISDQALYTFKQAGGQFAFSKPLPATGLTAQDTAAFRDAFERLGRYDRWLKTLPPVATFEKVAADLGLPARAGTEPGGDIRAGCLAKALELVRASQAERHAVAELVEYLGQLVEQNEKHDGISVRPHDEPVVRLMNLHKVKGLEAPVVFLADPSGEWDHNIDLHIDRSGASVRGYLAVYEPRIGNRPARLLACPDDWERLAGKEKEFQDAENDRLLYVAGTRAGTCLTIAQRESRNDTNPWQLFGPYLKNQCAHADPGEQLQHSRPTVAVGPQDVTAATEAIDQRWATLRRATYESEAIKEISLTSVRPAVEGAGAAAGEHGVEWGTVIHTLLETAMRQPAADLHGLARSLLRDQEAIPGLVQGAVATVRSVQQSALWLRAQRSGKRLVEIPLQMLVPAVESTKGLPTIRRGVIDLAFLETKGWVIVDYKTDDVAENELAKLVDHYRPQVRSYADAWQKLVQQPVTEVGLLFTRTNRYVQV